MVDNPDWQKHYSGRFDVGLDPEIAERMHKQYLLEGELRLGIESGTIRLAEVTLPGNRGTAFYLMKDRIANIADLVIRSYANDYGIRITHVSPGAEGGLADIDLQSNYRDFTLMIDYQAAADLLGSDRLLQILREEQIQMLPSKAEKPLERLEFCLQKGQSHAPADPVGPGKGAAR